MENKMNYAALVQEEFLKAGLSPDKKVSFCKVKKKISKENFKTDFNDAVILDDDTPKGSPEMLWIPLDINAFPNVLKSMTANQAGYWAIRKCKQQKWPITDWECCLTNLEMDM